jgi:hypothetical protein
VERRRQRTHRSRVKPSPENDASAMVNLSLPNIAELIDDGEITLGVLRPVGCVAIASDADTTYAMLVRRKGETLQQLLTRLEQALDKAFTLGIFTDEING